MSSYKVSARESTKLELGAADTVKSVLQAIRIIITTPKGTVPTYRDFGVNMDFLDLPAPGAEQRATAIWPDKSIPLLICSPTTRRAKT